MAQVQEKKTHRQKAAALGTVVFLLASVGLISVIALIFGFVGNLVESTRKEAEFERLIMPLVMLDPPSFDDPTKLNNQLLLQSSVWSILLSSDTSHYIIDDYDRLIIPASDVDVQCAKLYGTEVKLEHMTFGGIETPFLYDPQTQQYSIPVTGQSNVYTPQVEKIDREGDIYVLTVGYIPPTYGWSMNLRGETFEPRPQKYMLYTVKKAKDRWQIMAVNPLSSTEDTAEDLSIPTEEENTQETIA